MNKKIEIGYTYVIIIFSFIYGISFYYLKMFSKQNSWLICILGNIIGYVLIKMFLNIKNKYKNKTIYEINKIVLGKIIGTIINVIFTLTFIFLSCLISWYLLIFLKTNFLEKTPLLLITIIVFVPLFYAITKNNSVLVKSSLIYLYLIFILTIISLVFLFPQMEIDALKPFLEVDKNSMLKALFSFTSVTYLPTYAILGLKDFDNKSNKNFYKILFLSLSIVLSTYLVLGNSIIEIVDFPEFFVLRKIGILANGTRIDSLIIIGWLISIYISNLTFIYFVRNYLSYELKNYQNKHSYILVILIMLISLKLFKNVAIGKVFILNYLPIILFCILFIINLIIYLKIKVKQ